MPPRTSRSAVIASLAALCVLGASTAAHGKPRQVILMIADGAGYNTWKATAMYEGTQGKEFHDASGWVHLAVATHPLRFATEPPVSEQHALTQLPARVYDPVRAWDDARVEGERHSYPFYFAGYRYLLRASDSANTATALVTGRTTFPGSINVDGRGEPIRETLAWLAHEAGMRVGTVSSVSFNHATPAAAGGAHNPTRSEHCALAWEMLTSPVLDVIAGAGHPDYDNAGRPIPDDAGRVYRYVGDEKIWNSLTRGEGMAVGDLICATGDPQTEPPPRATAEDIARLARWQLVDSRISIESLRQGGTPDRLLLLPQVGAARFWDGKTETPEDPNDVMIGGTLQQQRGSRANPRYTAPGDDPTIDTVPTLEALTRTALNALDDDPDGFFLHVEGGAVDWAMHANQMGRMIEEMADFKRSVAAVVEWVESGPGWGQTLLVVTADHDHLLWGPDSDTIAFQALGDNGSDKMPSYKWLSRSHSNQLVPLYARGRGAEGLKQYATRRDPFYGPYLHQSDVFRAMRSVVSP